MLTSHPIQSILNGLFRLSLLLKVKPDLRASRALKHRGCRTNARPAAMRVMWQQEEKALPTHFLLAGATSTGHCLTAAEEKEDCLQGSKAQSIEVRNNKGDVEYANSSA